MKQVIIVESRGRRILAPFEPPARISDLIARSGIPFEHSCGGAGRCLKCRVLVTGALDMPSEAERRHLSEHDLKAGIRFSCMAHALGDVTIHLPEGGIDSESTLTDTDFRRVFPGGPATRHGIAVDLGTTTVVASLYRMDDGQRIAAQSRYNPQIAYGADVITRLEKSLSGQGAALAKAIRGSLSEMIESMCREAAVEVNTVDDMVIAGNTAMMYLLCGYDPSSIAAAPFKADRLFGVTLPAQTFGLRLAEYAEVYLARSASAFVGGDMTAAALAAGMHIPGDSVRMLCDIGTNGEIMLCSGGRAVCCSTAAGPAFEGAGITCGMKAGPGAIEDVRYESGRFHISVAGGEAAGICGSGIISAAAAMVRAGIVERSGFLHGGEFTFPGTDVKITQADIRAVQLAKSAIRAGMDTLMAHMGISPDYVSDFMIAGGFGSSLNIAAAEYIGLFPPGLSARARAVGNAAAAGASAMLLDRGTRKITKKFADTAETLNLSANPLFMDLYVDNMSF